MSNRHLRELDSIPFSERRLTDKFQDFATYAVLPTISIRGYCLQAKRELVTQMLHNLVTTGLLKKVVSDSRDNNVSGSEPRRKLWDQLINAGYAICCKGSESSGKQTRYQATNKLLSLQFHWDLSMVGGSPPRDLVKLHTGRYDLDTNGLLPPEDQKQPIPISEYVASRAQPGPDGEPDPRAIANGLAHWKGVEQAINKINTENFNHSWCACCPVNGCSYQPNVGLQQIHIGEIFRGARLYTWDYLNAQSIPRADREAMLIDREPTAELDFSCMHPRNAS